LNLQHLNQLDIDAASEAFSKCCTASNWINQMVKARPFECQDSLKETAKIIWQSMMDSDYMEAFEGHPKIGDPESLKEKYRNTHDLASAEQSSMQQATDEVIEELAKLNVEYEIKFGFIFIVCATGKSAEEMRNLIKNRIDNDPEEELNIAAKEQEKITDIRLENLLN
jgi:2-oxo-4-hydroxy-4-carboxy-5-ureidoimidazoline decarboxylase